MAEKQIVLRAGRERSVVRGHPWVFSGAIAATRGEPVAGDCVFVLSENGERLGQAAYSPHSNIRARMWTTDPNEKVDAEFFRGRIAAALGWRRKRASTSDTNSLRLIHGESDGLPGLIVDQYGDALVMQVLSAGIERQRDMLAELLVEASGARWVVERSDADVRALEGLPERIGLLYGSELPDGIEVIESGCRFRVDLLGGHKTGYYLDQRENRQQLRSAAEGLEVLDCFCYTGGFGIQALAGGAAHVTFVDSSAEALAQVESNLNLNGLGTERATLRAGDVFQVLRALRDEARQFDVIVLDPPKFAPTRAHAEKAARGYKDINLLGLKLLRPGGMLFTFSCSGGVDADLFQKILAGAAEDAGGGVQIVGWMQQDWDHPVALNFPEGNYLKGLVCRKAD